MPSQFKIFIHTLIGKALQLMVTALGSWRFVFLLEIHLFFTIHCYFKYILLDANVWPLNAESAMRMFLNWRISHHRLQMRLICFAIYVLWLNYLNISNSEIDILDLLPSNWTHSGGMRQRRCKWSSDYDITNTIDVVLWYDSYRTVLLQLNCNACAHMGTAWILNENIMRYITPVHF